MGEGLPPKIQYGILKVFSSISITPDTELYET